MRINKIAEIQSKPTIHDFDNFPYVLQMEKFDLAHLKQVVLANSLKGGLSMSQISFSWLKMANMSTRATITPLA